jgi:hypothetical protein
MIRVIYSGNDFKKIESEVSKAFSFVYKTFLIKITNITVRIYNNRLDFNKFLNRQTESWLVANTSDNNEIDILSPMAMQNESSHSKNEFLPILKHEFTHLFIDNLAKGRAIPMWLNEGFAAYIAKQHQKNVEPVYLEDNFCKKLDTQRGWNENVNFGAYTISALFVNFLIRKYSLVKIKQLISSLDKNYYYNNFEIIFSRIYKKSLNEVEKEFIAEINK